MIPHRDVSAGSRRARAILFLHSSDEPYGADRVLADLVIGLKRQGWEPLVLLPDDVPAGWLSARLGDAGIPVERAPLAPARRRYLRPSGLVAFVTSLLRARRYVRAAARGCRASIIHINTSALLVGAVVGRPGGARLVWHIHEIVIQPRLLAWLFRLAPLLAADRVVAVSDAVRANLLRNGRIRSSVVTIRNGIPPRMPPNRTAAAAFDGPAGPDAPVVAYVGRLNRWKGYETFVAAAESIAARFPHARFVLAGAPPAGEEWRVFDLEERVERAGLGDRIRRLGLIEDGAAVLEAADIVVVPSTWPDPLPTVVLEAMRAGCAVVASGHGGAPEMIEDEVSGILVPPADAGAIADAVGRLIADPTLRARMGDRAQARVAELFSVDRMVSEVATLYEELVR